MGSINSALKLQNDTPQFKGVVKAAIFGAAPLQVIHQYQ